MENKRQVQSLVSKSKTIVRLKPRNPDEKSSSPVIVEALCDFKQDQVGYMQTHTRREGEAPISAFNVYIFLLYFRKVF